MCNLIIYFYTDFTSRLHHIKNAEYWIDRRVLKKGPPLINDTTFRLEYWRRISGSHTYGVQVDMAYLEIMGVIKGSASLETNLEPLSRDAYTSKRWRLAPNFTRDRDTIYSLYENYEKKKKKRGEFDDIDRVIRIFKSLRESPKLQRDVEAKLHEIYVDGESRRLFQFISKGLMVAGCRGAGSTAS
jgi:Zn-finger nucleic acid-binding protein